MELHGVALALPGSRPESALARTGAPAGAEPAQTIAPRNEEEFDFDPNHVGTAGWAHVFLFALYVPFLAIRAKKKLEGITKLPDRSRYFVGVIVQQLVFLAVGIAVAWREWIELFPPFAPSLAHVAAGAGVLAAMILFMRPRWRRNVERRVKRLHLIMPRTPRERVLWVLVSLCAGFGEEIVYRGVLWTVLTRATGSAVVAASICVASFAVAHWVQGRSNTLVIAAFAALFHVLVAYTGALWIAMLVHAVYDVTAGFAYAYYGEKLGFPLAHEEPALPPAAA